MSRRQYLEAVLDQVEKYPARTAALIVSIDRRMSIEDVMECVDLSIALKSSGRRVVGIDLCGDPLSGTPFLIHLNICLLFHLST